MARSDKTKYIISQLEDLKDSLNSDDTALIVVYLGKTDEILSTAQEGEKRTICAGLKATASEMKEPVRAVFFHRLVGSIIEILDDNPQYCMILWGLLKDYMEFKSLQEVNENEKES